jgi:ATP-binding protein involved in chromosome partitioning
VVVVSTPQAVALADERKEFLCSYRSHQCSCFRIIENMAYFTPEELPDNKYYFLERRSENLAEDLGVPFLGGIPIVQSIREAGDYGRPAAMQTASAVENIFDEVTRNVVQETVNRNENLPASEAVKLLQWQAVQQLKKIENRKLDVLIVKLITACKNYVIITLSKLSHHKDMTTEELSEVKKLEEIRPF